MRGCYDNMSLCFKMNMNKASSSVQFKQFEQTASL